MAPSADCPSGNLLVTLERGDTGTHVGEDTIVNSHCLDPATGGFTNGRFTKTAANGDRLFGTYSGTGTIVVPPSPAGQFADSGTLQGLPSQVELLMEGTISSFGSGS
jgi:hypothetical protein